MGAYHNYNIEVKTSVLVRDENGRVVADFSVYEQCRESDMDRLEKTIDEVVKATQAPASRFTEAAFLNEREREG